MHQQSFSLVISESYHEMICRLESLVTYYYSQTLPKLLPSSSGREDLFGAERIAIYSIQQVFQSYQRFCIHQSSYNCCYLLTFDSL